MAKDTTKVPVDYGKADPNDDQILKSKIWRCSHKNCCDKDSMSLMGMKVHNLRMHDDSKSLTFRSDGHPTPEGVLDRIGMKRPPYTKGKAPKRRQSAERPQSHHATVNFCPCCGTSLQAFHAAADITLHG